jgi:hypothetical protein
MPLDGKLLGNGNGDEKAKNDGEIQTIVEVSDDLTSQSAVERACPPVNC